MRPFPAPWGRHPSGCTRPTLRARRVGLAEEPRDRRPGRSVPAITPTSQHGTVAQRPPRPPEHSLILVSISTLAPPRARVRVSGDLDVFGALRLRRVVNDAVDAGCTTV